LTTGDLVIAAEITVLEAVPLDETAFEYVGVVDSLDGTSLVVNGLTIDISQAEIEEDIDEGDIVRLRALSGVVREVERIDLDDNKDRDKDRDKDGEEEAEEEAEFKGVPG
jgi:hypothetical protein